MSRPKENRVRMIAHVLPKTESAIRKRVNKKDQKSSTIGRVLDGQFIK